MKDMKKLKKFIRAKAMVGKYPSETPLSLCYLGTYYKYYLKSIHMLQDHNAHPDKVMQCALIWSQTRACGLADSVMQEASIKKFRETISQPPKWIEMDYDILSKCTFRAKFATGHPVRLSSGPSACIESTRQNHGLTGELDRICRSESIEYHYDLSTMDRSACDPHPVRTTVDVLDYCLEQIRLRRRECLQVRVHTVLEPGKARVITVASFPYYVVENIFSHLWHYVPSSGPVWSGMNSTKHLWNFVHRSLNPICPESYDLWREGEHIWGLSTDLETATDFANPYVAFQIWTSLIHESEVIPDFPLAFAYFARDLFLSDREVYREGKLLTTKRRGWFMGDPMTKILLTIAQEYIYRSVLDYHVGSMVGDDLVILAHHRQTLRDYLRCLQSLDFNISDDDTVISDKYIFYCEECACIPKRSNDTVYHHLKRGDEHYGYVDYPRIRLLLPVQTEINRYSFTNLGRFSLLGKETRWTCLNGKPTDLTEPFLMAQLLQHLSIPRDVDTLCTFIPEEIGGDGSYFPDYEFVRRIYRAKSLDYRELCFRVRQLMSNGLSYRFFRTDKMGHCTHKYRFWVEYSTQEEVKSSFPEDSILETDDPARRALYECMVNHGVLVTPDYAVIERYTEEYFKKILNGEGISDIEIFKKCLKLPPVGKTKQPGLDLKEVHDFLVRWQNPGFKFVNHPPYFLWRDKLESAKRLNLGWDFKGPKPDTESNLSLTESDWIQICNYLFTGQSVLDQGVIDRLPLYMESDNFVSMRVSQLPLNSQYTLVSADLRLGERLKEENPDKVMIMCHPLVYLLGLKGFNNEVVVDPGAVEFYTINFFQDGALLLPPNIWLECSIAYYRKVSIWRLVVKDYVDIRQRQPDGTFLKVRKFENDDLSPFCIYTEPWDSQDPRIPWDLKPWSKPRIDRFRVNGRRFRPLTVGGKRQPSPHAT
jgi:hypothetical protein